MTAPRDTSFDECLVNTMNDPVEAAAYIEAVMEQDDRATLLVALRHVVEQHGMAEMARWADVGDNMSRAHGAIPPRSIGQSMPLARLSSGFMTGARLASPNTSMWITEKLLPCSHLTDHVDVFLLTASMAFRR